MKRTHKLCSITFFFLILSITNIWPIAVQAQQPHRVGLVVRFGDGSVFTKCIEFNEDRINGLDVLLRSGLSVIYQPSGSAAAVCKINNDGCNYPSQQCFCQCSGSSSCVYWSYWHLKNGAWQYSNVGATIYQAHDGDVEGWVWGAGSPTSAPQPPVINFNSICAPPPTSTPSSSPTPAPTATHTPRPTATTAPAVSISFEAQPNQITVGGCTILHWDVEYAQAVFLDGAGVSGHDSRQVCPRQTQTFELRVFSAAGETRRSVTVTVLQPLASPTIIVPSPTSTTLTAWQKPTQSPTPGTLLQPTTRPTTTPPVTMATIAILPQSPTAAPGTVASSTPQKRAVAQARQTPAQPTEPDTDEMDKRFPLELLGWLAIVGALLASLALVYLMRRSRAG